MLYPKLTAFGLQSEAGKQALEKARNEERSIWQAREAELLRRIAELEKKAR